MRLFASLSVLVLAFCGFSQNNQIIKQVDSLVNLLLVEHNFVRSNLNIRPLERSQNLDQLAQLEAKNLCQQPFNYQVRQDYGANIYRSAVFPEAKDVMSFWLREQRHYKGGEVSEKGLLHYGHYTQIIWAQTTVFGCGMCQTAGGTYILVCLYSPKGNIIGQKPH